jgi:Alpha-L-arabinofuranosidase B (ABFB) domain/Astacin (Peptidase family M12A)
LVPTLLRPESTRTTEDFREHTVIKRISSHCAGWLSLLALTACGGGAGSGDAETVALVAASPAEESALWQSQNPTGETLEITLSGRSLPLSATVKGDMAFLGDIAVGKISGGEVVGEEGQVLARVGAPGADSKQAELAHALGSGIVNAPNQKWPKGVIPYEIDPLASAETRAAFEGAKNDFHAKTVIRFVPRTTEAKYVRVITGTGCWSYVGTIGGRQDLSLGKGCGVNPARHELGHAVGLAHEQVRQDRDNYVNVNLDLTGTGRSQYEIDRGSAGIPIGPYDFESMMHYRNYKVNGRWIFEPKTGFAPEKVGNDRLNTFSPGDLSAIVALYGNGGSGGGGSGGGGGNVGGQGIALQLGQSVSFKVMTPGFTDRYLRHQYSLGFTEVVNGSSVALLKADASFRVVQAVDGTPCYSFESSNYPGRYLRHQALRLRIDANDGSNLFKADATFCAQTGLAGEGGVSFVSRNFPGHYIRHYNAEVWLAKKGGPMTSESASKYEIDASWGLVGAWAPGATATAFTAEER